jgi:HAD superfamily hydrolase (TIGR01484 family)
MFVRCRAMVMDGDGTPTKDGKMVGAVVDALKRLRNADCRLILATGESMEELSDFPNIDLFCAVVAEEGAVVCCPKGEDEQQLAPAPPSTLIARLREKGVDPLRLGRVIISTEEPHEKNLRDTIEELALDYVIHRNRKQRMALPAGIDKGYGIATLLERFHIPRAEVIGIGDAENDRSLFAVCGLKVAVANALGELKQFADIVTRGEQGYGVAELIDNLLEGGRSPLFQVPLGSCN